MHSEDNNMYVTCNAWLMILPNFFFIFIAIQKAYINLKTKYLNAISPCEDIYRSLDHELYDIHLKKNGVFFFKKTIVPKNSLLTGYSLLLIHKCNRNYSSINY